MTAPRMTAPRRARLLLAAVALATAAIVVAAPVPAAAQWESGRSGGLRFARTYDIDGFLLEVICAAPGTTAKLVVDLGGPPPNGQVAFRFDGGKTHRMRFSGGRFDADTPKRAKRLARMFGRLKAGQDVEVSLRDGRIAGFSLRGSSAAIGDCRT